MKNIEDNKGYIFDIQHYSIHDGPGIRTTIFLKGCPLKCLWCQNPESLNTKPQLYFAPNRCLGCFKCVTVCLNRAIILFDGYVRTNRTLCNACGNCIKVCPANIRTIIGKKVTAIEVYKKIANDMLFYKDSGGGVTLSGGEVFSQPLFAQSILKLCKDKEIHTAIETSGYAKWDTIKKVLAYVDLVLYDLKHLDPLEHKKITGVSNELIIENIKRIFNELKLPISIRIPVIPGYNNSIKNLEATAYFIVNHLNRSVKVNLLPYHRLGVGKRQNLEFENDDFFTMTPSDEKMADYQKIFESFSLTATIGG